MISGKKLIFLICLSLLLSGCAEYLELFSIFSVIGYSYVSRGEFLLTVKLRGSPEIRGTEHLEVKIVGIDDKDYSTSIFGIAPEEITAGKHDIMLKIKHIEEWQRLTLTFESKHRYQITAACNSQTKKF